MLIMAVDGQDLLVVPAGQQLHHEGRHRGLPDPPLPHIAIIFVSAMQCLSDKCSDCFHEGLHRTLYPLPDRAEKEKSPAIIVYEEFASNCRPFCRKRRM
jgi:hypothetical protein